MQRKAVGSSPLPLITQLHQPHLFCYFIESGRSLSMFLKTKPIVALNTGRRVWGLFPLKSLLVPLQSMRVTTQVPYQHGLLLL